LVDSRKRLYHGAFSGRDLRKSALVAAKVAVSLALLGYLFSTTDLRALGARVRGGDLLLLAAAVAFYYGMLAVATWRWRLLLAAQGFQAPLRPLSASYLVASFFNNFLPSNIGGDVIRVRDSSRLTGSTATSVAIVAIDRILGFGALYVLAAMAYVVGDEMVRQLAGSRAVLLLLGLFFGSLTYIFFRPGVARRLMQISRLSRLAFVNRQFLLVQAAVHVFRQRVRAVWVAFFGSVVLQALAVCYYYSIAHALRIALPLDACFLMVPLCTLVQAIPISFNGWGIRESLYIVYFGQVGLPRESALAFSLVGAGLLVLLSLSGAFVWMARGDLRQIGNDSGPGRAPEASQP
jgi:uncharacterized protein (TIRG00374 family)